MTPTTMGPTGTTSQMTTNTPQAIRIATALTVTTANSLLISVEPRATTTITPQAKMAMPQVTATPQVTTSSESLVTTVEPTLTTAPQATTTTATLQVTTTTTTATPQITTTNSLVTTVKPTVTTTTPQATTLTTTTPQATIMTTTASLLTMVEPTVQKTTISKTTTVFLPTITTTQVTAHTVTPTSVTAPPSNGSQNQTICDNDLSMNITTINILSNQISFNLNGSTGQHKCWITPQGERVNETEVSPEDTGVFSGLEPNTTYTIECKGVENNCSVWSMQITTKKAGT